MDMQKGGGLGWGGGEGGVCLFVCFCGWKKQFQYAFSV